MAVGLKSELGILIPQYPKAAYRELRVIEGQKPPETIAAHLNAVADSYDGDPRMPFIAALSLRDLTKFTQTSYPLEKVNGTAHLDDLVHEPGRRPTHPTLTAYGHAEVDLPFLKGKDITIRAKVTNGTRDLYVAPPRIDVVGVPHMMSKPVVSAGLKVLGPCIDLSKPASESMTEKLGGERVIEQILLTRDPDEALLFVVGNHPQVTSRR